MKFIFRGQFLLLAFLFFISCNKDNDAIKDDNFKPEDFKVTILKNTFLGGSYEVEYKLENLKDKAYKESYGYRLWLEVRDGNKGGPAVDFPIPDIPANGSIQGAEKIGVDKEVANPKVFYNILLD
ncbi:hypothetical protein [Niabella beijingensis]|uniref:hypothetical protein n=1 Tax=Niabella beijingensis TaxID=2872700 RepID=UPI001CBD0B49|nr:hypothetical protein [Niabella beijingensis]MBZ4190584.1 hypothetical protein [Niabella beijingensis]